MRRWFCLGGTLLLVALAAGTAAADPMAMSAELQAEASAVLALDEAAPRTTSPSDVLSVPARPDALGIGAGVASPPPEACGPPGCLAQRS